MHPTVPSKYVAKASVPVSDDSRQIEKRKCSAVLVLLEDAIFVVRIGG